MFKWKRSSFFDSQCIIHDFRAEIQWSGSEVRSNDCYFNKKVGYGKEAAGSVSLKILLSITQGHSNLGYTTECMFKFLLDC